MKFILLGDFKAEYVDAVSEVLEYPKVEIWGYYLRNAFCGTGFVLESAAWAISLWNVSIALTSPNPSFLSHD